MLFQSGVEEEDDDGVSRYYFFTNYVFSLNFSIKQTGLFCVIMPIRSGIIIHSREQQNKQFKVVK